jgi:predicted phosphoribosyltransferase
MGGDIITGPLVGEWVAEVLGRGYFAERSEAIGLVDEGIRAGVIYEDWQGRSIVCHIAFAGRLTSRYVAAIFDYPFNVCGVEKIIAPISSKNARALKVVKKMGFVEEARLRFSDEDVCFLTMTRQQCRFLDAKYGQKITSTAASA